MSSLLPHPVVPQTVISFTGSKAPRIPSAAADTVMIPVVHDWGPDYADAPGTDGLQGGIQELNSFDDWTGLFGDSDTAGRTAVAGAFAGQSLAGAVGAGSVIVARMVGASGARATVVINETGATPGLTLTGKYKGSRGNRISYTIDADPANPAVNDRLRLFLDGVVQETYTYAQTDVTGLAAQINARSALVTAADDESSGVQLIAGSANLAAGDDGSTLLAADHLNALNALRMAPASILACYDLTDAAIQASYLSWVQAQDAASRPVRWVVGGAAAETLADAQARQAALADKHVINFGVGTWHDDLLDKDLSTSQLAPRIAGILAARGQLSSLTYAKIGGLHAVGQTAADDADIASAVQTGVTVLMPAAAADADVRVAKGVTTYIGDSVEEPQDVFGDPRLVGIMDNYVRSMKQWGDDNIIGDLPVSDDSRNAVYGEARRLQKALLDAGLILPGDGASIPAPWVNVQNTDANPAYADTIPYTFGWQFAKTANAILGQGTVL